MCRTGLGGKEKGFGRPGRGGGEMEVSGTQGSKPEMNCFTKRGMRWLIIDIDELKYKSSRVVVARLSPSSEIQPC